MPLLKAKGFTPCLYNHAMLTLHAANVPCNITDAHFHSEDEAKQVQINLCILPLFSAA